MESFATIVALQQISDVFFVTGGEVIQDCDIVPGRKQIFCQM